MRTLNLAARASIAACTAAALIAGTAPAASAIISPGIHQIINRQDPSCLDVDGGPTWNGAEVTVSDCVNAGSERWERIDAGGRTRLRVEHSGKCLAVQWNSPDGFGSEVVQDDCAEAQAWDVVYYTQGWSRIMTHAPSGRWMCLDKSGWDVTVWSCHGRWWQQWQSLG